MNDLQEQFNRIYDKYIEKIYRFVYLKVDSRETAEDITSRVFLKGFESYKNEKKILNPGAFLYQIARNMVTDYYRDRGRTRIVSADFNSQIADTRTNLYEKAVINADIEIVKSAMQGINKEYQDILIWHYLEDMPAEQISAIINRPVGTIRVMIHRGLKELKDKLVKEA
jgi:RNA polymerase sigma-70 factor (ECF subfamily)